MHGVLEQVFQNIRPSKGVIALYTAMLIDEYKKLRSTRLNDIEALENKIRKIDQIRQELVLKYAMGKIPEDIYESTMSAQEKEKTKLEAAKSDIGDYQKDLDAFIAFGIITNESWRAI